MIGFVSGVVSRIQRRLKQEHKKRISLVLEQGIPLDRTWKVCEELLLQMDPKKYAAIPVSASQATLVRTPYQSLETYIKTLKSVIFDFKEENKIDRGWSSFETQTLTVSDFLKTEDGYYMTPASLVEFLTEVKELLELISQAEHEELGVTAHNVRVLVPFFVRLRDTLFDLYDLQFAL
jgi:hypothetical protein